MDSVGRPHDSGPLPRPRWALSALAVGAFGIGTTEFAPMGLLPVIARGLDVSIPSAGLLVTAYAAGVLVGAPLMTLALSRLGRRAALMLLMGLFILGNALSAMAPDYAVLLLSRLVTSLSHGAYFGLGAVVAASLVPRDKQAGAVAAMFMGLAIASIGGVPSATWIGAQLGWRPAFGATAAIGVVAMAALWLALPRGGAGTIPDIRRELAVLTRPPVLLAMATTVISATAMFTFYTYVAAALGTLTGASGGFVTLVLLLTGIGFTIGNGLGGRLSAWSIDGATAVFLAAMALIMLALPLLFPSPVGIAAGLLLWGIAAFAIVPPIQTRVIQAGAEAPGLTSSVNIGAFNLGNALGAAIGGALLDGGLGYAMLPVVGGILAALALVPVGLRRLGRRMPLNA